MWQKEWDETEKGRTTYMFFPNIRKRMELKDLKINHSTAQIITRHGHFNSTLYKLGLSETDLCKCGEKDTPEHLLYGCKEVAEARLVLVQALAKEGKGWPIQPTEQVEERIIKHLTDFAEAAIKGRKKQAKHSKERSNNTVEVLQALTSDNVVWRAYTADSAQSAIEHPASAGPARD